MSEIKQEHAIYRERTIFDPPPSTRVDHRAAALEWIRDNHEAFGYFERFALERAALGRRFGIQQVAERVRWEVAFEWDRDREFKINNNHLAYIARELVRIHPALERFITFRSVSC